MTSDKLFGLDKDTTSIIVIASAILCLAMAFKILRHKPEKHWQIVKDGEYYLTQDPLVQNGCVYFTDESGLARKVCGKYKMTKI